MGGQPPFVGANPPVAGGRGNWSPIFDEADKEYQEIVDVLKETNAAFDFVVDPGRDRNTPIFDATLGSGLAGVALFRSQFNGILPTSAISCEPLALINQLILRAPELESPSLFWGLAGVAWTVEVLTKRCTLAIDDPNESFDVDLLDLLHAIDDSAGCELCYGLAGLLTYCSGRPQTATVVEAVSRILAMLRDSANKDRSGYLWQSKALPRPNQHLGMAHGSAGVLAALAMTHRTGTCRVEVESLLCHGIGRLRKEHSLEHRKYGPVFTWCWGDLGLALGLIAAARATGDSASERFAIELARKGLLHDHPFRDASICHGSSGASHMLNRLFQRTKDEAFRVAARKFATVTLRSRQEGQGIAGYLFATDKEGDIEWLPNAGLVTGLAGVGLALGSAISDKEPYWDQFLGIAQ